MVDEHKKKNYMMSSDVFKMVCMRSKNTKKYAQYYILLDKCIKYYNDYEKLKLEQKINEINEIKLLKLDHSETLDNFVIFKCDIETLIVSKYNNKKYSEKHDYNTYPYAMVKGQDKNIEHTMSECNLKASNIMIKIKVPSQCNFTKRVRELLKNKFKRLVRFYREITVNGNENIREYLTEDDNEDEDEDELKVSVTRFFKLIDITENDFIDEVFKINMMRFTF